MATTGCSTTDRAERSRTVRSNIRRLLRRTESRHTPETTMNGRAGGSMRRDFEPDAVRAHGIRRTGCDTGTWRALPLFLLFLVGASAPALAQVDFVGEWEARYHEDQPERIPGPPLGDYLGLPINEAARLRADSWDASIHTLPEWQCRPHPADYGSRGPANLRVSKEVDPITQRVIAYHIHV